VAAAVMGNASISVGSQKEHLIFKSVRREWPPMTENHGLSAAPVFVIYLGTVFGANRTH